MLAERPEVVPYHNLPEMSAKEEVLGTGLSHQGADKALVAPARNYHVDLPPTFAVHSAA